MTMSRIARRDFLQAGGAAAALSLLGIGSVQADSGKGEENRKAPKQDRSATETRQDLVGTWTASPIRPGPGFGENRSSEGFDDETLRMIVRTSVGGSSLRVRLANTFGEEPVTIDHVKVGLQEEGAAVVSGSNRKVTFGGLSSVTIPPGAKVYSDPVNLEVDAEQHLAVSLYLPEPTGPATYHFGVFQTSYISENDNTASVSGNEFTTEMTEWYFLEGIDVVSPDTTGAIVTLGNSITDGFGSTLDANHTYPDFLANRINDTDSIQKSVLNAGIGGNMILNDREGGGISALARLDSDVIAQTGVTDVILLEGINDIDNEPLASSEEIIWGMKQIIARVHAKGLNIFGATLTPAGYVEDADWETPDEFEAHRQTVNHWIRTSGAFDGVFDFDNALKDPDNLRHLLPEYDSGDGVHPSDEGYRRMAEIIDLEELANGNQNKDKSAAMSKPHP